MTLFDGELEPAAQPRQATSAVGVAEITHAAIRGQLSDYEDGSLSERDRARVEQHLMRCPPCRAFLATLQATAGAVARLPRERAPIAAKDRLRGIPER